MSKHCVMGLFSDFDEAFAAIADIRDTKVPGVSVDDITLKSPIEHPEIEEVLGERPVHIQKVTLFGALFGVTFGFFFLAGAQATFLVQPQGGKPVVPLPSNFVLMYEMLIFFAVWGISLRSLISYFYYLLVLVCFVILFKFITMATQFYALNVFVSGYKMHIS